MILGGCNWIRDVIHLVTDVFHLVTDVLQLLLILAYVSNAADDMVSLIFLLLKPFLLTKIVCNINLSNYDAVNDVASRYSEISSV